MLKVTLLDEALKAVPRRRKGRQEGREQEGRRRWT
jgi:hypothetical protein